jgi:DNA polymerase-3 subunit gamma/tau
MAGDTPSPDPAPGPADEARGERAAAPLALYRRYRPASFADVKGQEHVTEPLRQALRSGRVHHAYLFSGPRGCGKTSSARILARSLNCELGPTPDPCGKCASCVALAPSGPGSIDVIEIDAASHGGVDDARDLRERAFYAPVSGRFKIYIIDEAHMVTGGGFNALLKLVEEPPPHLKFVFATTEPEKVIPTIRSRTHHYPFRLVPPAVLRELLEQILASEGVAYEPGVLPVVIRAGAGSVRDSLSVLDQLIAGSDESGLSYERATALLGYTDDALLDEIVGAFAAGDGAAVFGTVDRVVEGGHDPRRFAADLLDRLRDLIVLDAVPGAAASGLLDVPADRLDRMRDQATRLGQARLTSAAQTISTGLVEMRGATSPRLLLELMCAQVLLPAPAAAGQDVLARLDQLERRLGAGGGPAGRGAVPPSSAPPPGAAAPPSPAAAPGASGAMSSRESSGRARGARPGQAGSSAPGAQPSGATAAASAGSATPAGAAPGGTGGTGGTGSPGRGAPPAGAKIDADYLRGQWAAVLDAVLRERRVAWLLLSNATVDSLTDGVLTLRFGREGEARGFAISGHDQELGQVLQAMFGISPQIRAIAGGAPGAVPLARPAPGTGAADPDDPGPDDPGPAGPAFSGGGRDERQPARPPSRSPAAGGPPARQAAGRRPGQGGQRGQGETGSAGRQPSRGAHEFSGTEDPGDSDPVAVTGIDLIQRELGGQLIEESGEP